MLKKLSLPLLLGLACLVGGQPAQAIDFSEVSGGTTDPTIGAVSFFAGDGAVLQDTITDDSQIPGNPYLLNGVDDGTGSSPGLYDTFIGASIGSGQFATVSFDVALDTLLPSSTVIHLLALDGGVQMASSSITLSSLGVYSPLSISFAAGFDTVHIFDDVNGGFGELFHIDNFNYTTAGTQPIPEPATMVLMASGLAGMALRRRKKD